jgi:ATP-dependent Clp protease adapter protein ClpS
LLLYSFELTANELERQMPSSFDVEEKEADKSGNGLFCTVLYNDETHTFDLVIQTLTRALTCSKKDAIEFATTIDREGRSIVKVGGFTVISQNIIKVKALKF